MAPEETALSIVSPVFNAEGCVDELISRVQHYATEITPHFELLLIDDGSHDGSWMKIQAACHDFPFVKGIRLSRNFGQHHAITAGLQAAKGNYVILMDCDLQDDPRYFSALCEAAKKGNDIVLTTKTKRAHGFVKNIFSAVFGVVFNYLRNSPHVRVRADVGTYSLLTRKVVDAFLQVKDCHRHYLMVLNWLGFSTTYVTVEHAKRFAGKSSYNFARLASHAIDGITSQSDRLLYVSVKIGFTAFVFSLTAIFYLVVMYFLYGYKEGWASVMVAILTSTSLILMSLGVVGIYIGKIFDQAKDRPLYIVSERLNVEAQGG